MLGLVQIPGWAFFGKIGTAGIAGGIVGLAVQVVPNGHGISTDTVIQAALGGIVVLLFGLFIKQGNKIAALEAYAKRNKDDIDKLDQEARGVEKRIGDSRHLTRNEMTAALMGLEERQIQRATELRERLANLEDRVERHIERKSP